MRVLLAIVLILLFIYLGYMVSRLGEFLDKNAIAINRPVAILLGNNGLAQQVNDLLVENKIEVFHLTEPFLLVREQNFRYLFALSENDTDNLVLCKTVHKIYEVEEMVSICNDQRNQNMYVSEKIKYISAENATAPMICKAVLQELEVVSE